jgi:DNA-directed RNA polymerase specialized sigma24 family protein
LIESYNRRGLDALRKLSDEDLAREAARGDEGAAKVLLERFEEPLYRYTVALLRDADLAREATWSALFEGARRVRADEHTNPVAPWLFQIAHTAADVAGGRPDGERGGSDDEAALRAAASGPDRDRLEELLERLDALPARDRGSLLLRELIGLEYAGIATVTGARASAARQSVYRARLALQGDVQPRTEHCDEIRAAMSKAEVGIRERRSIASHVESCEVCEEFAEQLEQRGDDLRTLFPPPPEPLVAELLPPLPPAPAGSAPGAANGGRRPRRRPVALVPVLLGLLLVAAAVATAIALNDSGGGKKQPGAAAGAQARATAPGAAPSGRKAGSRRAKPHAAARPRPHAAAPATPPRKSKAAAGAGNGHGAARSSGGARSHAKPGGGSGGSAANGAGGGGSTAKGSGAGGTTASGGAAGGPAANGGAGGAGAGGSTANGSGGAGGSTGGAGHSGTGGATGGGAAAKRAAPCRRDPQAPAAQSAYSDRAGAAQAALDPCVHSSRAAAGLASTGLDLGPVVAAGLLLLGLGVGLRRVGRLA